MIYTLGESLLDIIITSKEKATPVVGGGMLNTAVSLARSGAEVSLISEVGDDPVANIIIDFLMENGVESKYVKKYYHQDTSVALAFLDENKNPSFSIHKSYPEKRRLIMPGAFSNEDVLVFGSLYSLTPAIRHDLVNIVVSAKRSGAIVIYDPNIRRHNLDDRQLSSALSENIAFADIVKASEEDLRNIFGDNTPEGYRQKVLEINPDALFVMTLGEKGVTGFFEDEIFYLPAIEVDVVSTIGAGDAFNAGMAYYLQSNGVVKDETGKFALNLNSLLQSGLRFSAAVCATMDNYVGKGF